ncbi:MAG: hypothetical protein ACFBSD_04540 [Paracoccaceae bacterium]
MRAAALGLAAVLWLGLDPEPGAVAQQLCIIPASPATAEDYEALIYSAGCQRDDRLVVDVFKENGDQEALAAQICALDKRIMFLDKGNLFRIICVFEPVQRRTIDEWMMLRRLENEQQPETDDPNA